QIAYVDSHDLLGTGTILNCLSAFTRKFVSKNSATYSALVFSQTCIPPTYRPSGVQYQNCGHRYSGTLATRARTVSLPSAGQFNYSVIGYQGADKPCAKVRNATAGA